jgi:hypothetical protein
MSILQHLPNLCHLHMLWAQPLTQRMLTMVVKTSGAGLKTFKSAVPMMIPDYIVHMMHDFRSLKTLELRFNPTNARDPVGAQTAHSFMLPEVRRLNLAWHLRSNPEERTPSLMCMGNSRFHPRCTINIVDGRCLNIDEVRVLSPLFQNHTASSVTLYLRTDVICGIEDLVKSVPELHFPYGPPPVSLFERQRKPQSLTLGDYRRHGADMYWQPFSRLAEVYWERGNTLTTIHIPQFGDKTFVWSEMSQRVRNLQQVPKDPDSGTFLKPSVASEKDFVCSLRQAIRKLARLDFVLLDGRGSVIQDDLPDATIETFDTSATSPTPEPCESSSN